MNFLQPLRKYINKKLHDHQIVVRHIHPKPHIFYLQKHFGSKQLIGAEIGVYRGQGSEQYLKHLNMAQLLLVDPYPKATPGVAQDQADNKRRMLARIKPYQHRCLFIKQTSDAFFLHLSEILDFVYIDGVHSYEQVTKDLENSLRAVKKNGLICGDDFGHTPVTKAVIDFCMRHGLYDRLIIEQNDFIIRIG